MSIDDKLREIQVRYYVDKYQNYVMRDEMIDQIKQVIKEHLEAGGEL